MDNNLKLILEINRISNLMGKEILSEQNWGAVAQEVLAKAGKNLDNVEKAFLRDLQKAVSDAEIIEVLAKLAKRNPELEQKIYRIVFDSLPTAQKNNIDAVKNWLETNIKNRTITDQAVDNFIENWTNTNFSTQIDGFKQIIRKELQDVADAARKSVNPSYVPPVKKTGWDRVGSDLTELGRTELENLDKLYRAKGLGKSFIRASRQFAQEVLDMLAKDGPLIEEAQRLAMSIGKSTDNLAKANMMDRLSDVMNRIVQKDKQNFQIINNWLDTNVLDATVRRKIKATAGYDAAGKLLTGDALKDWMSKYKPFWTRRGDLILQINQVLNPGKWIGKGNKYGGVLEKWREIFKSSDFAEFRRWVLSGQTQSRAGIKETWKKFGLPTAILNLGGELAYGYLMLSIAFAFTDWFTDKTAYLAKDIKFLNNFDWFKNQIKSNEEHMVNSSSDTEVITTDVISYWTDEIKELSLYFPGFADDFFKLVADFSRGFSSDSSPEEQERQNKLLEKAEDIKKKIQEEKDKIKQKADSLAGQDQGDTTTTEEPVSAGTYGETLDEFKRWLKEDEVEGWGEEDFKTLTGVDTKVINNIKYYVAKDATDNYWFTYNDGKYKKYKEN